MKIGDYIVAEHWPGRYMVEGPLTAITEQMVRYGSGGPRNECRVYKDKVRFAGAESVARKLAERLTSSAAQMDEEVRAARLRHSARIAKFAAEAQ